MQRFWRYVALFVVLAFVSGAVYWLLSDDADWWAYVDLPQGRLPKFELTWPEQWAICGVAGSLIAAPATLVIFGVEAVWSRLANSRAASSGLRPRVGPPDGGEV